MSATLSYQCLPDGTGVILDPSGKAPLKAGYERHEFRGAVSDLPKPPGELRRDVAADTLIRVVPPPSPIAQARAAAAAAFAALPPGKQALWESTRAAVDKALSAGKPAAAVEIIQTVPAIYDGMEADRIAFLALFSAPAAA